MKFEKNNNYKTIAIYAFATLFCLVLAAFLIFRFDKPLSWISTIISSLSSILIGFVIAYFLNPFLKFFENKVFKKINKKVKYSKLRRGLSLVCVFLFLFAILAAFVMSFIPQLTESINTLIEHYGTADKAINSLHTFIKENKFTSPYYDQIISVFSQYEEKIFSAIYSAIEKYAPIVMNSAINFVKGTYNVIIGLIFSVYVLCYKERLLALLKKFTAAFFSPNHIQFGAKLYSLTDKKFGKYITGKVIDSIIVGIVSYLIYWIFGFKFYPLLALIAGVTNMIPFFGPFLGAVPAGIIVLIAQPGKFIWLLVIILILQQLDGNILDPLIVGDQVGLIPVFTMSATLLFGDLFGIPGMLLGVPIVATIYTLVGETVGKRLSKKGLPVDTGSYYSEKKE